MAWPWRIVMAVLLLGCGATAWADPGSSSTAAAQRDAASLARLPPIAPQGRGIDQSGRKQKGRVSYYARRFAHRKMADGMRFNPNANIAASKNLPLGTTAKVTNLTNGKSAVVRVEDRGPWIAGRVIDVTPKVAVELGIRKAGLAPVIVAPITVPQMDGAVKLGAGADDASAQEMQKTTEETEASAR